QVFAGAVGAGDRRPDPALAAETGLGAVARAPHAGTHRRDARLRSRVLGLVSRHEVDDGGERIRAVEDRTRTAHDLDALDVGEIGAPVEADVSRAQPIVVRRLAVDEHQDAIAVAAEATEPAHADGLVTVVVPYV